MSARDYILNRLRTTLARPDLRFPPRQPSRLTAKERMTVTQAEGSRWELARRFGQELEALHGSYELVETPAEARLAAVNRLMAWVEEEQANRKTKNPATRYDQDVLTWDTDLLPVPGLAPALTDMGFRLVSPTDLQDEDEREEIKPIRAGITSVDAAFASTGSFLLASGPGKSRAASLTPFRHLVLIPLSQLYPTVEDWMAEQRQEGTLADFVRESKNLALISGPSKSADIEGNLTLGVHGPKIVHALLYEDIEALIQG